MFGMIQEVEMKPKYSEGYEPIETSVRVWIVICALAIGVGWCFFSGGH